MAQASGPSFQPRRSWRAGPTRTGPSNASKWFARLGLTLIGCVLLGLLLWLLISPFFRSQTHLVALPVVDYDALYVPPIMFSQEDVQALDALAGSSGWGAGRRGPLVLDKLKDSQAVQSLLGHELRDIVRRPKDVLIFWLSVHGVSDDGEAYLLLSDFDPTRPDVGRCKLSTVLQQIHDCPAKVKLVLLDAGRIVADVRLGMVANEFPRLLEQQLRGIPDPHLWVLTANDWLEASQVSWSLRRSLFGYVATEGLAGAADFDEDGRIELGELSAYVRGQTSRWAEKLTHGEESQTPLLFQGGSGLVSQDPVGIELVRIRRHRPTEPAPAAEPAKSARRRSTFPRLALAALQADSAPSKPAPGVADASAPAAQPVTAEAKAIADPAQPAATNPTPTSGSAAPTIPAAQPAVLPATAAQPAVPAGTSSSTLSGASPAVSGAGAARSAEVAKAAAQLDALFSRAWDLRDQLEDNRRNGGWSPVDYAPHLWHEFNLLLLGYELRFRSGTAFDTAQLAADVERNILPVAGMLAGNTAPATTGRATLAARLMQARERFLESDARASYDRVAPPIKAAEQQCNRLLFQLPYYVQWQMRFTSPSLGARRISDQLSRLEPTFQGLPPRIAQWSRAGNAEGGSDSSGDSLRRDMAELQQLQADLERLLENETLSSRSINPRRWMNLLATPLPTAPQRTRLLAALARDPANPPEWSSAARLKPTRALDADRWRRLRGRLELAPMELPLAELAGAADARLRSVSAELAQAASDRQSATGTSSDQGWAALRTFGKSLETTYRALPQEIRKLQNAASTSADPTATLYTIERLLRMVDGRDAKAIPSDVKAIVPLPTSAGELKVSWIVPEELSVRAGEWTVLDLELSAPIDPPADADLSCQFDSKRFAVRAPDGHSAADPIALSVGSKATRQRYQVRCLRDSDQASELVLSLHTGGSRFARTVRLVRPQADLVELTVVGSEGTVNRRGRADTMELAPYPNTSTDYHLALVNHSGRARKVKLDLWSAPATDQTDGRTPTLDSAGHAPDGFETIASVKQIDLPADEAPVAMPFSVPAAPAPGAAPGTPASGTPAAGGATATGSTPAEEKKSRAIGGGVLCSISDLANPDRKWIQWLPIEPQRPSNYLQAEAEFDRRTGRITASVHLAEGKHAPPLGSKIRWETGGPGQIKPLKAEGEITDAASQTELFAVTDADRNPQKKVLVALTVDGWPRAFEFEIPCAQTLRHIAPLRDVRQVRITSPEDGDALAVLDDGKPESATIPITLSVDAPLDAFRDPADGGVVELGFNDRQDRSLHAAEIQKTFHSDRQTQFLLEETGPAGLLKIGTRVGDFKLRLDRRGYQDLMIEIVAQLKTNNKEKGAFARVALDGTPPSISIVRPRDGARLDLERDVDVSIVEPKDRATKDLSGIRKVECVFGSDKIANFEKPALAAFDAQSGVWQILLPTKGLRPGDYYLTARATDRVDFRSLPVQVKVTLRQPPGSAAGGEPPPKTGRIVGRVVFSDKPQSRITVTLSGAGSVKTDESGSFTFDGLRPGKYQLKAIGSALNKLRESGPTDVTVDPSLQPTMSVTIELK